MSSSSASSSPHYVIWVRHCESCSNVALSPSRMMFVEPFCTSRGVPQSFAAGKKLVEFVYEFFNDDATVSFYSSVLPRAMQTVRIISEAFLRHDDDENDRTKQRIGERQIHRLPHISERWLKGVELKASSYNDENVGSANTTTNVLSRENAKLINSIFSRINTNDSQFGLTIADSVSDSESLLHANDNSVRFAYSRDSYSRFLTETLNGERQDGSEKEDGGRRQRRRKWLDPKNVSVIVSHGWFIAAHVIAEADAFELKGGRNAAVKNGMDNTEAYLVRYDSSPSSHQPLATVLARIKSPSKAEITESMKELPPGLQSFVKTNPYGNCSY